MTRVSRFRGPIAAIAVALFFTACKDQSTQINVNPEYQPSQAGRPVTERWVYKLRDDLHLVVGPVEWEHIPIDKAALRAKFPDPKPPSQGSIQWFHFFVPGETALHDAKRYHAMSPIDQNDDNVVRVMMIEPWTAEMNHKEPVAMRDARIGWKNLFSAEMQSKVIPQEYLGMQCYRNSAPAGGWQSRSCLVERRPGEWAIFDISDDPQEHMPYPGMRTQYFSTVYRGLTVAWSARAKHASKWREIDAKLWQLISQQNIAKSPLTSIPVLFERAAA